MTQTHIYIYIYIESPNICFDDVSHIYMYIYICIYIYIYSVAIFGGCGHVHACSSCCLYFHAKEWGRT